MRRMNENRFIQISSAEDQEEEGEGGAANVTAGEDRSPHQLPPGQGTYDDVWDR
jgi:hypothetical protein